MSHLKTNMWIRELFDRRKIRPTGVIHLGAHQGEELDVYRSSGVDHTKIVWVEAIPAVADALRLKMPVGSKVVTAVVSDKSEPVRFNVANNVMSSSMLPMGTHLDHHPHVKYVDAVTLVSKTFRAIVDEESIDVGEYDTLVMDIQGAEMKALRGMDELVKSFKHIITEISLENTYEGGALFSEISDYLETRGFELVEHNLFPDNCGDAYFRKL